MGTLILIIIGISILYFLISFIKNILSSKTSSSSVEEPIVLKNLIKIGEKLALEGQHREAIDVFSKVIENIELELIKKPLDRIMIQRVSESNTILSYSDTGNILRYVQLYDLLGKALLSRAILYASLNNKKEAFNDLTNLIKHGETLSACQELLSLNPEFFSPITFLITPKFEELKKTVASAFRWRAGLLFEEKKYNEALEDAKKAYELGDEEAYKLKQMIDTMIEIKEENHIEG